MTKNGPAPWSSANRSTPTQVVDHIPDMMDRGTGRGTPRNCRRFAILYAMIPAVMGIGFDHVGLCVAELDAAQAFYERAFGFRLSWRSHSPGRSGAR